jgi:membrane-associated protease RseP (regulator of RpoE activity)
MPLRELVESGRVAGVRILRGISTENDSVVLIERAGLSPSSPLVIGQRFVAGLQLAEVDPSLGPYFKVDSGVLVTAITYPSPGASAGIVPGDVVVAVAGRPVATIDEVRIAFAALPPEAATTGEGIPISVVRQGETVVLRVPR